MGRLRVLGARLKEQAPFYEVYADRTCQQQLSALAQRMAELVQAEDRIRLEPTGREAPAIEDVMAERLTALRDILWSLEHDLLQTIDPVTWLGHLDQEACPHTVVAHTCWASVGEIMLLACDFCGAIKATFRLLYSVVLD